MPQCLAGRKWHPHRQSMSLRMMYIRLRDFYEETFNKFL